MKVSILHESGYAPAMLGLSLNKRKDPANMPAVAKRLAGKDDGHDKFLRMISVWLDVSAPRFFWHEMDQYKIGRSDMDGDEGEIITESESTMNNLLDRPLTQADFEHPIYHRYLMFLNLALDQVRDKTYPLDEFKSDLPEGYLQRRVLKINYAVARNILATRSTHRLPQWRTFCEALRTLEHVELLE